MANVTLKVSTDTMKSKAQEITKQINAIEKKWNRMYEIIENSKTYWEGDASDCHRKGIIDDKTDMETILRRLKEHPKDLLTMAGIYVEAEQEAKRLASALPKDVIV